MNLTNQSEWLKKLVLASSSDTNLLNIFDFGDRISFGFDETSYGMGEFSKSIHGKETIK